MADEKNEKNKKNSPSALSDQSSILIYGVDNTLSKEDDSVRNIVQKTILNTKAKFGNKTGDKPIDYFKQLNFNNNWGELLTKQKEASSQNSISPIGKNVQEFKKYMTTEGIFDVNSAILMNSSRLVNINNYRIMYKNIPDCSIALKTYKDNIISPDDFTKKSFNVDIDGKVNKNIAKEIKREIDEIIEHYDLEKKVETIISDTLMVGEQYVAVLSLEDELKNFINNNDNLNLNEAESFSAIDPDVVSYSVLSEDIKLTEEQTTVFKEVFNGTEEEDIPTNIAKMINENVEIGSVKDLLLERIQADESARIHKGDILSEIPGATLKSRKDEHDKQKKNNDYHLYINGSAIKILEPEKVIELVVDDICFGYYYAEDNGNMVSQAPNMQGPQSGREIGGSVNIAANNTVSGVGYVSEYNPNGLGGISDQKLKVIGDVFVNNLAKKVDRTFIKKNKKFKEFIYSLLKQDYIVKKGLKLTYFMPNEIIKFEAPSIYRNIVFFAKLYLSTLVDDILTKLGRRHDKRIFYVNVGADANYEQAIQKVIQDIKTKEYKMDNMNDFNTILNLNPGRWDDYFMPTINGDKPIDIDIVQGADIDINNEFTEFLRNSMAIGMEVPRNLVDTTTEIDFARSISAQNANFLRGVVNYQRIFGKALTKLIQALYRNEKFFNNKSVDIDALSLLDSIRAYFNSPAALNMTNISEQIALVDQNSDFIVNQYLPQEADGSNEGIRNAFKKEVVRKYSPAIDWDEFDELFERVKIDYEKEKLIKEKTKLKNPSPEDPYGGGGL